MSYHNKHNVEESNCIDLKEHYFSMRLGIFRRCLIDEGEGEGEEEE
jgi:hypothetical protein